MASDTAAAKSRHFLSIADQFRLGDLVTEASHPRTRSLSDTAKRNSAEGLRTMFDVDRDVLERYRAWAQSGDGPRIARVVAERLENGGRLYFTGCGATGRLSIQLAALWRNHWQERLAAGDVAEAVGRDWEDRAFSVMAGGDFALIKSVEGFEDYAQFGRRQIEDLGVSAGDVVFAITEGGETSFVIGTAWQGLEKGAKVYFV
jgi:N-acetylmuramic acid 6-phosphate etherase